MPTGVPPVTVDHLECNEIVQAPTGAFIPGTFNPASSLGSGPPTALGIGRPVP